MAHRTLTLVVTRVRIRLFQLPKLDVVGSNPIARYLRTFVHIVTYSALGFLSTRPPSR